MLPLVARGQERQFAFDANGNLIAQTAEILAPPQILAQPQPQVVWPGALASFFVVATDTSQLTYQWRFNGTNIGGATNDSLLLLNVGATNEGQYSVVLFNSSGSVTSAPAALLLDGDRDGLPDSWELANFGNLNQYPTGDSDGDGVSNLDEFLDGTNPASSASLLFRLTVQSNGGLVTVNPSRFTFTNGEIVTLTATGFSSAPFRLWTGDTNTTSNAISLTMTNNKTVFAHFGSLSLFWTNLAGGDWHVASNWKPNLVPGTNDDAIIRDGVIVTLNSPGDCQNLTFGDPARGPTLTGSGSLTLHGASTWERGTMSGGGRTVIAPGATLNVASGILVSLNFRTLENGGALIWTAGNIAVNGAVITNRAGALFEARSAIGLNNGANPGSRFDNAGTFRKSISTGTTTVFSGMAFNNYGAVEIQTGTLALSGGGVHSGTFDVSAGSTLSLSGGAHTASAGSSITGEGNLTVTGGTANLTGEYYGTNNTLTISGGTANFNGTGLVTPSVVSLSSGTLGGNQMVTVLSQMNWSGGTMSGSGRTVIPPGATLNINGTATKTLSGGRILENGGTTYWNAGNIQAATATVITNRAGALFLVQSAAAITPGAGGGRFDNAGTFRKSSAGTTTINNLVTFNNYGAVEIQSGTLAFAGVSLNDGEMDISAGATLNFSLGTFTSSGGSSIVGAGNLTLSSGIVNLAGLVNVTGSHTFTFATANLTGNYICTNNTVTISGATANFSGTGTVTPSVLNLSGGSLGGSQHVTVLGQMNWTGGTISGSGRTIIPPGATLDINGTGTKILSGGRILENGGTTFWNAGNIQGATATVITNRAGALFLVQSSAAITGAGGGRFDNAGTFRKTSAGTTTINNLVSFNNYGTVEIQSGTLSLVGGGLNDGTMDMAAGTTLNLSGGTFTSSAGSSITGAANLTVSGAVANLAGLVNLGGNHTFTFGTANLTGNYICTNNTVTISGATANFSGTGTVTPAVLNLSGGALSGNQVVTVLGQMNWTGGTMSGSGRTIIPPGATLDINGTGTKTLSGGRILENGGTTFWNAGNIQAATATVITNRAGALFLVQSSAAITPGAGGGRFDNAGTFRKTSAGTTTINNLVSFNNYGTVEIRTGILAASGGYNSSSNALLNCALGGTTAGTGYGQLQVAGTVTLNGALGVSLVNGFLPTTNDTFTVLTATTRTGAFANFYHPSNEVTMQMSNTVNSVIVRVTGVAPPRPLLLSPEILGTDIRLIWTALSNTPYRVEYKTDLGLTNWIEVAGDVTTLSNTASKLDALTASNRFYRVRVLP